MKRLLFFLLLLSPAVLIGQDSLKINKAVMKVQTPGGFVQDSVLVPHLPGQQGFFILINNVKYPNAAKEKGVSGSAVISVLIDANGTPSLYACSFSPSIENSGLKELFQKSLAEAVGNLPPYVPAEKDGKKVAVLIESLGPINFTIH